MPKLKPDSVRTYDVDGYRRRAACFCCNSDGQVLMISSNIEPDKWIIPGGGIEPLETPEQAAAREILEEAGARVLTKDFLGTVDDEHRKERNWIFLMEIKELQNVWRDSQDIHRKRRWLGLAEAREVLKLYKPNQIKFLDLLPTPHFQPISDEDTALAFPKVTRAKSDSACNYEGIFDTNTCDNNI